MRSGTQPVIEDMRLHILSDLHLEFAGFTPDPDAVAACDVVVLAGDIAPGTKGLHWARRNFGAKPVVYVAGNHEFYGFDWTGLRQDLQDEARALGIHYLERGELTLDGVRFLGCTLWTDFAYYGSDSRDPAMWRAGRAMADYYLVSHRARNRPLCPDDTLADHLLSQRWLMQELGNDQLPTVVVTHHLPFKQSVAEKYADSDLTPAFASHLDLAEKRPILWIHGHTHDSCDYWTKTNARGMACRVICNPRGYPGRRRPHQGQFENQGFNPKLLVEIPT